MVLSAILFNDIPILAKEYFATFPNNILGIISFARGIHYFCARNQILLMCHLFSQIYCQKKEKKNSACIHSPTQRPRDRADRDDSSAVGVRAYANQLDNDANIRDWLRSTSYEKLGRYRIPRVTISLKCRRE